MDATNDRVIEFFECFRHRPMIENAFREACYFSNS